ncbi:MAG: hypothetical protein BWY92_01742 [Firmicutes bacterium ADurb.BinA052]|nr:MAG: hypothetical protein BWY92_01742 [Firmicutes bacterium ADurb.BinA052]
MTFSRRSLISSIPRFEAASTSMTSMAAPSRIPTHDTHFSHGSGVGPRAQLSALASTRAVDVLPVPRGPANRYAWVTRPAAMAFFRVLTTCACPTMSSKF